MTTQANIKRVHALRGTGSAVQPNDDLCTGSQRQAPKGGGLTWPIQIKPVYSIPEFGSAFDIGRTKTYDEIKRGRLRAMKIGKLTRISGEDAMAWLDSYRSADKAA